MNIVKRFQYQKKLHKQRQTNIMYWYSCGLFYNTVSVLDHRVSMVE